ncbi:endonuclease/exonuclease/phosphatase family protein [Zobellia galactanivorans]|uniref:endonuclease/exonuclease/phosphatase family protein n=1 Tax=Zobellia galactanivorans (strain DSM 12802 / CCUG 47099 / CIP 106680 / NCIMB 13871 / Dsij) TaxID=63186 RepID=UPI0026E169D7|nr:endonuclease/exonuclease/phosphatase family protein [Zobellia galactanivorans]MDO6807667.1 endonuclease/exonuclease/phosphatase family protein [Zobellia galactanivorans]
MKKIKKISILALLLLGPFLSRAQSAEVISAMTFNIRYANPKDGINIWENRRDWLCEGINFFDVDVFGAQEVIESQLNDMVERLPAYDYVGIGRNGDKEGEFCPVFFKKVTFELMDSGTFWLSETPEKVNSQGWDAALPRIMTWVKLRKIATGEAFYFFNTHFDHRGKTAQLESTKLIRQEIQKIAGDKPFLITGDFNFAPSEEAYTELTSGKPKSLVVIDSKNSAQMVYGPDYTFNGFALEPDQSRERIDYVFTGQGIKVHKHHIIDGQRGGNYISDHFPIKVIVSLR